MPKSRARAQQSVSSRASSMGRWNVTRVGSIRRKTHAVLPQHNTNSEDTSGRWITVQGRFKMQLLTYCAHTRQHTVDSAGRWNLTQGSIRRKAHTLPDNAHSNGQHFSGAMDESSGKGSMMQAHRTSGVVIDIATFKVSHAVGVDIHATALQAKKKERITFHRGDG